MLESMSPTRSRRGPAPNAAMLFDRSKVRAKIKAAHADEAAGEAMRPQVLAILREALDHGRQHARRALEAKGSGLVCAAQLAFIEDELIESIYHYVLTYVHPARGGETEPPCAIAAVGGYGRATLAPGSDIDLLFLLPEGASARTQNIIQSILYILWDLGQKVGHSTRTIEECLSEARGDFTVRTALLEARFLLGDAARFEAMRTRFEREIVHGTAAEFVAAKLAERDARIAKAGRSRYLVEPQVKDGKGGLRDLNTLFWIGKYVYEVREPAELVGAGLFSRAEYRLFVRCEEFLWRVRCHLHFLTGRAEERLTFDHQREIAAQLGYSTRGGLASVERFMKHYFLVAKEVGDLTAIVCAALEEKQAKPHAMLDRFGPFLPTPTAITAGDFAIESGRVTVAAEDAFDANPVNLVKLFWVADRNGLAIHPDATRLVTRSLKRIDAKLRADPEANRLFLDVLTSRNTPEIVLRLMNEAGVLGRFVPEFGKIVALMQFNMYHHYTVDEHLLRAVGNLADLEQQRFSGEHPLASEILLSISNRTALVVALFLHDVAKGRLEDHSTAGAKVARVVCPRLGLSDAETETVAWLIENHLVMSDTAQRRDLGDRQTVATFAQKVQTLERLKMLFILTVCDIRAVGPGVWNHWKAELLRTLYWETEMVLAGGHSTIDRRRRVAQAQLELRRGLPNWTDLDFVAYAERHPQAYWLKADLEQQILHAKLLNMTEVEMPAPVTHIVIDPSRGVTELTVIAPDHPKLLSVIAGACAASSANIVDAQVFTTTDGMALDTIVVSRAFDYDEDELRRASRIAYAVEKALAGDIELKEMVAARGGGQPSARQKTFRVHPEVTIDNTLSARLTVVEVSGLDRPGLLFDLTTALSGLDLNISSAHIATFGERAADVFYVTDLNGEKIASAGQQDSIRRSILKVFEPQKEELAPKAGKR
ncbi:[Protein-PII] uridylyltransferase / [Protein-PII]-UMP uridylyl-removing enzyme [Methylocella tundrae]|uniref:Bifunctional uridylyltransferase/uridylyl-removing enzyme n=2 Tax=Methylocella tundrae TaxID=227605 RepID=A0A4U8Z340_METTU|nr:[Protein-PII] uridylyltransferase / [Protein-PII]-UMP uridylyl-removing enzyme [Methylocella tundrae]